MAASAERLDADAGYGLTAAVVAAVSAILLAALVALGPGAAMLPLAAAGGGLCVWWLVEACKGRPWALATLLAAVLVVPNINFQSHEIGDTSLNPQNGAKLALWAAMELVAAARWRHFSSLLQDPVLRPALAFVLVAVASTLWSPVPAYTAAGALGLLATLLFACAVASDLPEDLLWRVIVGAAVAYLAMNVFATILIPDVAWDPPNGDDAMDDRLQGLASHPNILAKEVSAFLCLATPIALARGAAS